MKRSLPSLAAAAAVAAVAPGPALAAPTLSPLKPCYVSLRVEPQEQRYVTERIRFSATGLTPNARADVLVDGVPAADDVPVDAAGNLPAQSLPAPYQERGEREIPVTVVEDGNAANTVTVLTRVSALAATARPRTAGWRDRVTFRGRGFTAPGRRLYGHYLRRGRHRETVALGRPKGPCGTFSVRRRQFPFRPTAGTWTLRIDQSPRYSRRSSTNAREFRILVRRRLRLD